jgi:hypothetical protein
MTYPLEELHQYQHTITRYFDRYQDDAVVQYDIAYRKGIANNKGRFGSEDALAHSEHLAGRDKVKCFACNETGHTSNNCTDKRAKKMYESSRSKSNTQSSGRRSDYQRPQTNNSRGNFRSNYNAQAYYNKGTTGLASLTCHKYNFNGTCPHKQCRYKHTCNRCGAQHPASHCTKFGGFKTEYKPGGNPVV